MGSKEKWDLASKDPKANLPLTYINPFDLGQML